MQCNVKDFFQANTQTAGSMEYIGNLILKQSGYGTFLQPLRLLSVAFSNTIIALKSHMSCYNSNLNFFFLNNLKIFQTAINMFQNSLEDF